MRPGTGRILPWATSIRPVLTVVDPAAVVVAGVLLLPSAGLPALLGSAIAAATTCRLADLHRTRLVLSVIEDLPGLVLAAVAAVLVLAGLDTGAGLHGAGLGPAVAFGAAAFALSVLARTTVYAVTHLLRRSGAMARPAVVVGAGSVGRRLAVTLLTRREHGLVPVGIVDSAPPGALRDLPLPLLGAVDDLPGLLGRLGVRDVLFAFAAPSDQLTVAAVRACLDEGLQVYVVPRFHEATVRDRRLRTELVDDVAVVRLPRLTAAGPSRVVRGTVDVVAAACGLVVLAPVLVVLALAVRVENGPAVLVRQTRVGVGGRTFTVLRFRSVRPAELTGDTTSWSLDGSRRGPVGRLLRRTGLDELPQLLDVLRGDLSIDARERREPPATPDVGWWERPAPPLTGPGEPPLPGGRAATARGRTAPRRG